MARAPTKSPKKKAVKKSTAGGGTSQDRILQAIGSQAALGTEKPDRKLIMGMAVMLNERSYNTTLLNIRKKTGFIEYDRTSVWLTDKGRDHVGEDVLAAPASNDAMQEKIRSEMIKGCKPRQIYDVMLDGDWYTKDELAEKLGIENNRSFGTYMSSLSQVTERNGKQYRLKDFNYPCGRPEN